jgi:hypothetical protein
MDAGTALRIHRLLLRVALSSAAVFAWIFIFQYFVHLSGSVEDAFIRVAFLYALSQLTTSLLTPLTARGLRDGIRREMVFGVLLISAAFVLLGAALAGLFGGYILLAIIAFALMLGGYRALYWVPYEAELHTTIRRPSYLSFEILVALMPVCAAYALVFLHVHQSWLLFAASVLLILSLIPLIQIPDRYERVPLGYRETFGQLFLRAHRRLFFSAVIDGTQGAALLLFWPLTVFLFVGGSYLYFGILFSITFLVLLVVRRILTQVHVHSATLRSLPVRVAIVSSAWIGRAFVGNIASVVLIDAYGHVGNSKVSTDHLVFEQSSDGGHFIDEYTTLREIGLAVGRVIACCLVALLLGFLPVSFAIAAVFVVTGIGAGLSVIISGMPSRSL